MRRTRRLPRVVAFGGGHGLAASLSALRRVTDRLTAIVTVADDGGSSGRLRAELNCLPPGDLRMALAALCGDDESGPDLGRRAAVPLQRGRPARRPRHREPADRRPVGTARRPGRRAGHGGPLLGAEGRVLPMASVPLEIEADVIGVDADTPDEISQ